MEKNFKKYNINFYIISLSFLYILLTTQNFNLDQTRNLGGSDGFDYYLIAKEAPQIAKGIQFIKSERFFFPYFIGLISKLFSIEIFLLFKFFSIILCISLIYFINKTLKLIKCAENNRLILILLIIFNPYILRYYLALPTLINDLIFLNASLLIIMGLVSFRIYLFIGIGIGILVRQNILAFIISSYSIFILSFIFKKFSKFLVSKDIILISGITVILYLLNFSYASMAETTVNADDLYYVTIFGLFVTDYNLKQLLIFILFPLLTFGPLIYLYISNKLIYEKLFNSLNLFIILTAFILIMQPMLGGPVITGKNFIRLANYSYPILLISFSIISNFNIKQNKPFINVIYFLFLILWSLHPTYSIINIFEFLKFNI